MSISTPAPAGAESAQLFTDHLPWLLQRLSYRLRNRTDAEDLASETFLRTAPGGMPVSVHVHPGGWLMRIEPA